MIFFNNYVKSQSSLITCALPGLHNISNSIAAISIASFLGIKMHDISSAMLCFKGISRRFDIQINKKTELTLVKSDEYNLILDISS